MQDLARIKLADTDFPVHPLIASRWSPRAYDPRPVESDKLQRIFEAARWAASASNLQPWYFLVGFKGDEVYTKFLGLWWSLIKYGQAMHPYFPLPLPKLRILGVE